MLETLIKDSTYLQEVRKQYENYPYPPRDPKNEKISFNYSSACSLDAMNYYHFSGKRDFSKVFSTLIAGGGTGDSTIHLAEQLRDYNAEIVHLDISETSIEIAKNRSKVRGLDNITWVHGSLLDAQKLLKGKFDHINCCGVLHHLESPEAGLAALTPLLKDDGVMEIMLYAKYGRESVYQLQTLMRILNKNENNLQHKVENCKTILKNLSGTNSFISMQHLLTDIKTYGDAGIYDMLLHTHDVAYSVSDIYKFLASSDLNLTHFFLDLTDAKGNDLYKLESYIDDSSLTKIIGELSIKEKQAAAELIHSKIIKHHFYSAKSKTPPLPSLDDLDNIPSLSIMLGDNVYKEILGILKHFAVGQEFNCKMYNLLQVKFIKTANVELFFNFMDGYKSIREIFKDVRASYSANEKRPTNEDLKKEFKVVFEAFILQDLMFLRDKSVPKAKTLNEINDRLKNI